MPVDGWNRMLLGDFVTLQRGHDLPEDERRPGRVPILGSFGITGYHDEARATGPGVTVGRSGASFGVVSYSPVDFWPLNTALYVVDFHGNDERFAYYFLQQLDFKRYNSGSAQPSLNRNFIHPIPVEVPPLPEQRAIARILGTLDDKIELNRRMNQTLEAIARALFKSWFVDFNPVRAKVEGCEPGLPKQLADLFPDSFEGSDFGEIPAGWRVSTVGAELTTLLGGTPSRAEPSYWEDGTVPWINSGKANEFRVIEPSEFVTQEGMDRSATKLLPERTTIIAITGATLGQVSLLEMEACANQSIVGVLGSTAIPSEFVYFWVKERISELISWQTGGAQQHINKNNVNDLSLLCPAEPVMQAYLRTARPVFDRIKANCLESLTLAALRDTLLPKLISGELRIKNAERIVGGYC